MEDGEMPGMQKYGESKTTRIMIATVRNVTSGAGRTKFQAAWFLLNRVYQDLTKKKCIKYFCYNAWYKKSN
jgi:hypothetical protein